jgi:hypothetical protein
LTRHLSIIGASVLIMAAKSVKNEGEEEVTEVKKRR